MADIDNRDVIPEELNVTGAVMIEGAAKGSTPSGNVTSTNIDANTQALDVNIAGGMLSVTSGLYGAAYVSVFNEVSSIASGIETVVATYTVPPLTQSWLQGIDFDGDNVAVFKLFLNGSLINKKHTHFGGLFGEVYYASSLDNVPGLPMVSGDVLEIKVIHERPFSGSFSGRMQIIEV